MWGRRYFPGSYFAPRYFPEGGGTVTFVPGWEHAGETDINPGNTRSAAIPGGVQSISINPGNTRSI